MEIQWTENDVLDVAPILWNSLPGHNNVTFTDYSNVDEDVM